MILGHRHFEGSCVSRNLPQDNASRVEEISVVPVGRRLSYTGAPFERALGYSGGGGVQIQKEFECHTMHLLRQGRRGLLLAVLALAATARSQTTFQTWPEIDAFYKLSPGVRLSLFASKTREDRQDTDAEIGPNIDFYVKPLRKAKKFVFFQLDDSKSRLMMVRSGYRYMPSTSGSTEHRGILEATARYPLAWGVLVSDRNRVDIRSLEEGFSWRYRNRLTAERDLAIKSYHFAPYLRAEAYFDSRYRKFSRTSETIGVPFPVHRLIEIEPYYEHQNDTSKPPNRQINSFGFVVNLYFKSNR
jgi:hypothetical protein